MEQEQFLMEFLQKNCIQQMQKVLLQFYFFHWTLQDRDL